MFSVEIQGASDWVLNKEALTVIYPIFQAQTKITPY
jgi:hypothetical protein